MKKTLLATALIAFVALAGCKSTATATATGPDELDATIREASDYLNDNIPAGSKIVILNVQSDSAALSDYIIDELIANAVNDRNFEVVDRQQLDLIRQEQNFQWAGEVDDNLALEVGKFFGAQMIVSGRVSQVGDRYRFTVRALEVQTARVQGQNNWNMNAGKTITALMRSGGGSGASAAGGTATGGRTSTGSGTASGSGGSGTTQTVTPATPATPAYKVGDTGPAGGLIFYDKGNNSGGWRYLEAAPADVGDRMKALSAGLDVRNNLRETGVGWGKRNTEEMMKLETGGGFGTAAQACDSYELNGFDDWYLPSRDELNFVYGNLHMKGLGGFRNDNYWSSSLDPKSNNYLSIQNFADGSQDRTWADRSTGGRARPIRQF